MKFEHAQNIKNYKIALLFKSLRQPDDNLSLSG